MIWQALLLIASLVAPMVPTGDGHPPVTIIQIPDATTTTTTATVPTSSLVLPETTVLTTSATPATNPPPLTEEQVPRPVQLPSQWIALAAGWVLFVLVLVRQRSRPTAESRASAISGSPSGGLLLALRHYKPAEDRSEDESHSAIPVPDLPAAESPTTPVHYEAVEYRSEFGSSEIQVRSLGEFGTLEVAINTARIARSSFVLDSVTEAFWVVWNQQLKRAAWIAEAGTPGESVIDLRTPASRVVDHAIRENLRG